MASWVTMRYLPDRTMVTYRYPYHGEPLNITDGAQRWTVWHKIVDWHHERDLAKWQLERSE